MAILNHLSSQDGYDRAVGVFPLGMISRCGLKETDAFAYGIKTGGFSEDDAFKLFDHCFLQLALDKHDRVK